MKKSNIVLAILAGAAIGGIIAIALKAENAIIAEADDEEEFESESFDKIAKQFSEKISSELKTAENKIKSAVQRSTAFLKPEDQDGVFL